MSKVNDLRKQIDNFKSINIKDNVFESYNLEGIQFTGQKDSETQKYLDEEYTETILEDINQFKFVNQKGDRS